MLAAPDSSFSWNDVQEAIFPCVFCDRISEDPKQLPCLHTGCRACLHEKIDRREGETILCPKCSFAVRVPNNGIDGFRTDYFAQSVGKLREIQLNLDSRRNRCNCCICGRNSSRTYCCNCEGYLCRRCYERHKSGTRPFEEHQSALMTSSDFSSNEGNVRTLFCGITPKCKNHPTEIASECCVECDNEVFCAKCLLENHHQHETKKMSEVLKRSKEELDSLLAPLTNGIADAKSKLDNVDGTNETVSNRVKKISDNLRTSYSHDLLQIKTVENYVQKQYEEQRSNIRSSFDEEIRNLQKSKEEEIRKVVEKYEKMISDQRVQAKIEDEKIEKRLRREEQNFGDVRKTHAAHYQTLVGSLSTLGKEKKAKLFEMKEHFNHTILRHHNFTTLTSSVQATGNDWITLRAIDGIVSAAGGLMEDVNKSFPSLASLAEFPSYTLPELNLKCDQKDGEEEEEEDEVPNKTKKEKGSTDVMGKDTTEI